MKKSIRSLRRFLNRNGSVVIFIALALIMLLGFGALAFDIGYITVTKNELQNISDGASLAATRYLGEIYKDMSYEDQQTYNAAGDADEIIAIAKEVGLKNQAGKKNITINDADVIIGKWDGQTKTLTPTLNQPDAVRVIARRSQGSFEGPISNFFAKILGKDTTNVEADAIAALTGESTSGEGGLHIPVGIPKRWFEEPDFCNKPIKFHPTCPKEPCTGLGCAGWNGYTYGHSAIIVRKILEGTLTSPEVKIYETQFDFTGGDLGGNFDTLKTLFDKMKVKNDGTLDSDEDSCTWTTRVVVYDYNNCTNPSGEITIVGFSTATIYMVTLPSGGCDTSDPCCARFMNDPCVKPYKDGGEDKGKSICAWVRCNNVEPGRGGGGYYGTKGTIPNLVE